MVSDFFCIGVEVSATIWYSNKRTDGWTDRQTDINDTSGPTLTRFRRNATSQELYTTLRFTVSREQPQVRCL